MILEDFKNIVQQCAGNVDQFALGGRGDPGQHENFVEMLELCREHGIVPNFTTSGYGLTPELARECLRTGAVAVSRYGKEYTYNAINMLLDECIKTNIHYILSKGSIDEAITRLERDDFPKGINAVIFLLYKPTGQAKADDALQPTTQIK